MTITRLNDIPKGESICILLYGGGGTGKTWFCGTAGDRTLIINISLGILTLQSPLFRQKVGSNPIIHTITEDLIPDEPRGFDAVKDALNYYTKNYPNEFDVIVIDDVTELRRLAMNKALQMNAELGNSKSLSHSRKYNEQVVAIQDYGQEMNLTEGAIRNLVTVSKELNKHLIVVAHERITYNKATQIGGIETVHKIAPGFTGKAFPDETTGIFDFVWHTEAEGSGANISYVIRTAGDNALIAKSRGNGLFKTKEVGLTFPEVIKRIKNA